MIKKNNCKEYRKWVKCVISESTRNKDFYRKIRHILLILPGSKYYRLNGCRNKVDSGYPRSISSGFVGLPSTGIDGGFEWRNRRVYFYTDNKYYRWGLSRVSIIMLNYIQCSPVIMLLDIVRIILI